MLNIQYFIIKTFGDKIMQEEFKTQYVWTAGHEYVALEGLTHRPRKVRGSIIFEPHSFRIGLIEESHDGLLIGRFPKEYWASLADSSHFKDFKEHDDKMFSCVGKLFDLMEAVQREARYLQAVKDLGLADAPPEQKEQKSVLFRLIEKWLRRRDP